MTQSTAPSGGRTQYVPDWESRTPVLTTEQTRITINRKIQRPNDKYTRTRIEDAFDWWAAAGAAANVAMQLGWPEVAYGVIESKVESGALMKHPWKRLRTTEQYLAVALLGTDEERAAYREAINSAHRHVRSTETSPVKYNAFNRELQLWVAACLYIGFEGRAGHHAIRVVGQPGTHPRQPGDAVGTGQRDAQALGERDADLGLADAGHSADHDRSRIAGGVHQ